MMDIATFIRTGLSGILPAMSAEPVTIGGETAQAIISEGGSELFLADGGDDNRRSITAEFIAGAYSTAPRSGKRATARGTQWQIERVDIGQATWRVVLLEPERRA
jgi:hypothetical protein